jgi:endonuclease III
VSKKINVNQTKFNALWKRHSAKARVTEPNAADLVALLVHSSLLYDATRKQADEATQRIRSSSVDWNEFRVNLVDDMVGIVGVRYPDAFARMKRLRMSLNDVYLRHHRVSLDMLVGKPKRDVRTYLENLEGMPAYVVARFMLLAMGVPLIPVDQTLVDLLVEKEVLSEPADPVLVGEALAKVVRPDKAAEVHASLVVATDEFWTSGKALKVRKDREKLVEQTKKAAESQRAAAAAAALAALRAREEEAARAAAARPSPSSKGRETKAPQGKAAASPSGAERKGALAVRKGAGSPTSKAKGASAHKAAHSGKPVKAVKLSRSPARSGRR